MTRSEYMKKWRKEHPHYSRDYMREVRAALPRKLRGRPRHRTILGVPVQVNLLSRLFPQMLTRFPQK